MVYLQFQIALLVKNKHQDTAHILCVQHTHDLQFLFDILRQRVKLRIEIKLLFIGIRRAQYDFFVHITPPTNFKTRSRVLVGD